MKRKHNLTDRQTDRQIKDWFDILVIKLKRLRLKNHNFTLVTNNCIGGIIYHDLGEKFNSPTINLSMSLSDYMVFLEHFSEAIQCTIEEYLDEQKTEYPLGIITLSDSKTIIIHFVHYSNFSEAKQKWEQRKKRINPDNMYVLMESGVYTTNELIDRFSRLPFSHKAILSNIRDSEKEFVHYLDVYNNDYENGKVLWKKPRTFKTRRYLDDFDYVSWING